MNRPVILLCAVAIVVSVHAGPAHATHWSSAAEVCQGALPSFEGALRKRPLGIANEGASPAFVSCALHTPLSPLEDANIVSVLFHNTTTSTVQFACTLVDGVIFAGPIYIPKTITINPAALFTEDWDMDDNDGNQYRLPNLSCSLPAGVEINALQLTTE